MEDTVFCYGEGRRFPKTEFADENGQLIHKTGKYHYASTGDPVDTTGIDDGISGPLTVDFNQEGE